MIGRELVPKPLGRQPIQARMPFSFDGSLPEPVFVSFDGGALGPEGGASWPVRRFSAVRKAAEARITSKCQEDQGN